MTSPRLAQMMLSTQNGGAETFFEKLALAFSEAGIPQSLIIEPDARRLDLFSSRKNIEVHSIRYRGIHEPFGRLRGRAAFRKFNPDLILTWMNRATKRAPRGISPVLARYGGYYKIDRCRDCQRVIANTPDIRRYLLEGGLSEEQAVFIPNFAEIPGSDLVNANTRETMRRSLGLRQSDTVIFTAGRLHVSKAHDTLIRAVAQVPDIKVLIAGDGGLEEDLKALAASLNVADRVQFLGWRSDAAQLYAAADLCVFPSRIEPFGNIVVEAWSQKLPLIAADSTGPKWLIDDGVDGLLFPMDDVSMLVNKINELVSNPVLQRTMVENGYQKYLEQFTVDAVVRQYLDLFAGLKPQS